MGGLWEVFGRFLEHLWDVFGRGNEPFFLAILNLKDIEEVGTIFFKNMDSKKIQDILMINLVIFNNLKFRSKEYNRPF